MLRGERRLKRHQRVDYAAAETGGFRARLTSRDL